MAEEVFCYVEIGGCEYRVEKFSPVAGLQLARLTLAKLAPVARQLADGVAELSHDPVTALALCAEALKWGLGDFFGESASSLLGALFAPSSPRRP